MGERPTEKNCGTCNRTFKIGLRGPIANECPKCRRKLPKQNELTPTHCKECGTEFQKTHGRQTYCSKECAKESIRDRNAIRQIFSKCLYCETKIKKTREFCSKEHKDLYYETHPKPTCKICSKLGAEPTKDPDLRLNYKFCSPLHRHWYWCDTHNQPRGNSTTNTTSTTNKFDLGIPYAEPIKRTEHETPREVQIALLKLVRLSFDIARDVARYGRTNTLKKYEYERQVKTITRHTKEDPNNYRYPIKEDNLAMQFWLDKENKFDFTDPEIKRYSTTDKHNIYTPAYLAWVKNPSQPFNPHVPPNPPTKTTTTTTKTNQKNTRTPNTPNMPNEALLKLLPNLQAYYDAVPPGRRTEEEIEYMRKKDQ